MDENLIEVTAIIEDKLLSDVENGTIVEESDVAVDEDDLSVLIDFEKLLEKENKRAIRRARLAKIRDGLLRIGKVIVKGTLAAGAIAGLLSTLIPALTVAGDIATTLISIGVVSQVADSGSKLVETFKAGRAPLTA